MQYGLTDFYTCMMSVNSCSMFILMYIVGRSNTLNRERKMLFSLIFMAVFVGGACEWLGVMLDGCGGFLRYLHIFVKFAEFSITPTIPMLLCWIIDKKWVRTTVTLASLHMLIEFISMKYGFIFYIDAQNIYHHGEKYWIYVVFYTLATASGLIFLFFNTGKYQYNGITQCLMIAFMILLDTGIQLATGDIRIFFIGIGMGSSLLYITVMEMLQQTDGLTELLNRISFENYITSHNKKDCLILFFDVDSFKYVNDNYGHEYGDTVLKNIGSAIKETYVSDGKCFRYGGDEFCVILTKNMDKVEALNEEFVSKIKEFQKADKRMPYVSVGYMAFHPGTMTMKEAIDNADRMMYQVKHDNKAALQ